MCQKYDITFKKRLGQNLLLDDNINRIMVESADLDHETDVVEVGAGLGALTARLHHVARQVLAIEIDMSFMPCLEERFGDVENVTLFRGDVLNHSMAKLVAEHLPEGKQFAMVSNVPYYITTPLLFQFWESGLPLTRMVVMVQEEVALRLTAPVNSRNYGILALAAQAYSDVDIVHRVPRTCFKPEPKVDSCIVRMRNLGVSRCGDVDRSRVLQVVRLAFSKRRKTLRNTLARGENLGLAPEAMMAALEAAGIDPGRRPQTLGFDEFVLLTGEIEKRRDSEALAGKGLDELESEGD
jgi:16S rRNA (adenine1518-N6/adenine1519-N6)-dimethyltransferase